ncbi:hypothetical protein E4T56_gene3944 [Termitomyces sp. T112]|nr:hypothetical protein E4T56_gene3944 [Termitomyces sp. T112]
MATSSIHNAIYSPEYEPSTCLRPHRRNDSSTSGTTTLQGSSDCSHFTEPLLQHYTSEPSDYLDLSSPQPPHTCGPCPERAARPSVDGDLLSAREHKILHEQITRRQSKRLLWYKCSLEIVITSFAIYNTTRYLLAFTVYESIEGQTASLALGICTGAVFALTICSIIVWLFQPYLLLHRVPLIFLWRTRTVFHSAASLALFAPAAINTVLLFVWKNSPIEELNIRRRCHVDIDVIWSVSGKQCKPPAWDVWIALSILRLVITIIIIIFYHWIAVKYSRVHLPSLLRSQWNRYGPEPSSELHFSPRSPPMTETSPPLFTSPVQPPLRSYHRSSDSTLHSHPQSSKDSSNRLSLHSIVVNPLHSDEETVSNHHQPDDPEIAEVTLDGYHEHFRELVSKITRETEEALALQTAETADVNPDTHTIDFYRPRIPFTIGYDEFGCPYRPDEHVPIMNNFVRRMPTIESMGSREVASSIYSRNDTMRTSVQSSLLVSRPLTRADTVDNTFGSRHSSFTNNITPGAETLLRSTEVGELVDKSSRVTSTTSSSSSSSSPSTMLSYHTATSHGSTASFGLIPGTR